eukprot:GSChrysophyteH1.ASY1.ANO1.1417.1 assembled CDS
MLGNRLLTWIFLLLSFSHNVVSETSQNTTHLLHELYDRTGGQYWNYAAIQKCKKEYGISYAGLGKWDFTKKDGQYVVDPCSTQYSTRFIGINCSTGSITNVTAIMLPCGNLTGVLRTEMNAFTEIEEINFSKNNLAGTIPEMSALTRLRNLRLNSNTFTGKIPEFKFLTRLQNLYLYQNKLAGKIPEWSNSLMNIKVYGNKLTGTIPDWSNLINLRNISLSGNQLTGTIPELKKLKYLQNLYLYNNTLTGKIPEYSNLKELKYLYLYENKLTGTIPDWGDLTNLQYIGLSRNDLSGTIPEVKKLTKLKYLYIYRNQMTGTIPELSTLTQLNVLHLAQNRLTGLVPTTNSSYMDYIDLHSNSLTGTIPEGAIPDLSLLAELQYLYLAKNQLTGTIPDVHRLSNLTEIALGSNCLEGTVPEFLSNLKNLKLIDLTSVGGSNFCKGNSAAYSSLDSILNGFVTTKSLTGTIPGNIWKLPRLEAFYIGGNRIYDTIPETLSPYLRNISLPFNYFHGKFPSSLATNPNISNIAFQNNRFQGNLDIFKGTHHFESFNASINNLSGFIPKSLLTLSSIDILSGNVFECSYFNADQIPKHDPSRKTYACAAHLYFSAVMLFLLIIVFTLIIVWYVAVDNDCFQRLQNWRAIAQGHKWTNTSSHTRVPEIYKLAFHLFDIEWSVLRLSGILFVILVSYVSLGANSRLLQYNYLSNQISFNVLYSFPYLLLVT